MPETFVIYLVLMASSIKACLALVTAGSVIASIIFVFNGTGSIKPKSYWTYEERKEKLAEAKTCDKWFKRSVVLACVFLLLVVFMPSTNQLAILTGYHTLTNSEDVSRISSKAVQVLEHQLDQQLSD